MGSKVQTNVYEIALNVHINNSTFHQRFSKAIAYEMLADQKNPGVFLQSFFATLPWTNRGQTVERPRIVVERPRIVVEQPRIVVDTPQKKCFESVSHLSMHFLRWPLNCMSELEATFDKFNIRIYVYTLFHISTPKPAVQLLPTSHPGMVFWNSMIKSNSIDCSSKWCIEWNMS